MEPPPVTLVLVLLLGLTAALSAYYISTSSHEDAELSGIAGHEDAEGNIRNTTLQKGHLTQDNRTNETDTRPDAVAIQQAKIYELLNMTDRIDAAIHLQKDDLPDLPDVPQPRLNHSATAADIWKVSLQLWQQDMNRMTDITVNRKGDGQRFFKHVDQGIQHIGTYTTMRPLLRGTYNPDLTQEEQITAAMIEKEEAFLNAVNSAQLTTTLYEFLHDKGMIQGTRADFFNKLQALWFGKYRRQASEPINSCGFEHVFVGEYRGLDMIGLHNWVQLYWEEQAGNVKLYYQITKPGFGYRVAITWTEDGVTWRKDSSFLLGNSPEYQIAVFTLCLLYDRAQCKITNGVNDVNIVTHVHNLPKRGGKAVGSAYPQI